MMRFVSFIFGLPLLGLGLFGVPMSLLAIIDPVGAQGSNDSDPFGVPPSTTASAILLSVYVLVGLLGFFLCYRGLFPRVRPKISTVA